MKHSDKKIVKELKSRKPCVSVISEEEKLKLIANLILDQLITKFSNQNSAK